MVGERLGGQTGHGRAQGQVAASIPRVSIKRAMPHAGCAVPAPAPFPPHLQTAVLYLDEILAY